MNILCSELYETQLKEILQKALQEDFTAAKKFKLYLDALLVNIPTKEKKYKQSIYFDDENIKDLEYENFTIIFFTDKAYNNFLILGILEK